uniref:Uncharacterized protein n=1 Tax=Lactuca sativa TaxID=4236 RepID=A0A9R1UTR6_LACSA|nr:hypothetical protein LSAT_V11C800445680 [Lactuca sativa]
MYNRKENEYLSASYKTYVDYFLDVAFLMKKPPIRRKDDVKLHLLQHEFTPNYTTWWAHGESTATFRHEVQPPNVMEDDELDGCTHMVMDAIGSIDNFKFNQEEQVPNPYAKGFYYMLHDVDEPLWVGCQIYSKLQASSELLNWKSEYNIPEDAYDHILSMIKRMLPPSEKLVGNFYETKNHDRYKSDRLSMVPYLRMRYLPVAPRLKREPGLMAHLSDGDAWKHLDSKHPEFASDPGNVRLWWYELKLKLPPTQLELFEKTHRTKKSNTEYITPKAKIVVNVMVTRYGDDSDSHPTYDHGLWIEASGGIKKGRVLGFGYVSDPQRFLMPSLVAPSTTSDNLEVIMVRICEEMNEELKSERDEMKQALLAECTEIEAQKQEIAKMYNEILKLAQGNSTN